MQLNGNEVSPLSLYRSRPKYVQCSFEVCFQKSRKKESNNKRRLLQGVHGNGEAIELETGILIGIVAIIAKHSVN